MTRRTRPCKFFTADQKVNFSRLVLRVRKELSSGIGKGVYRGTIYLKFNQVSRNKLILLQGSVK